MEPIHMKRSCMFGDVALLRRDNNPGMMFQETTTSPSIGSKDNSLVQFASGGTGFLVSIKRIKICGLIQKLALILTASHAIMDIVNSRLYLDRIICFLENDKIRVSYLVKNFIDRSTDSYVSNFTNSSYCGGSDISILLMQLEDTDDVNCYQLESNFYCGESCFISGFPKKPSDFLYSVPLVNNRREAEFHANLIFCGYDKKIYSNGFIESFNNGLVEVSCSTTNGLSGSPIITNGKVIGVYAGGPPLPGQKEIINILKMFDRADLEEILNEVKALTALDIYYKLPIFALIVKSTCVSSLEVMHRIKNEEILQENEKLKFNHIINNPSMLEICIEATMNALAQNLNSAMYQTVILFSEKTNFLANVGISTKSIIFGEIFQIIEKFDKKEEDDSLEKLINNITN